MSTENHLSVYFFIFISRLPAAIPIFVCVCIFLKNCNHIYSSEIHLQPFCEMKLYVVRKKINKYIYIFHLMKHEN